MNSWPHAPPHILESQGVYIVTGATYQKEHYFRSRERLQLLQDKLLSLSQIYGWEFHAWAVFSNHYHFVARSPIDPRNLQTYIAQLHQSTASTINQMDQCPNRQVWFQFWDTKITYHRSYMARLNYVHQNPVKHGIVPKASMYPWCSAHHFEASANKAQIKSVYSFDYNKVNIYDEF